MKVWAIVYISRRCIAKSRQARLKTNINLEEGREGEERNIKVTNVDNFHLNTRLLQVDLQFLQLQLKEVLVLSPDLSRRVYHFQYNARDTESDPCWGWFWVWD